MGFVCVWNQKTWTRERTEKWAHFKRWNQGEFLILQIILYSIQFIQLLKLTLYISVYIYHTCTKRIFNISNIRFSCYKSWLIFPPCTWHFLEQQFKRPSLLCNFPPDVRMTALWAPMDRNVTRSASVRMEPSVTISMEPVYVKQGLKGLIARRDSVPQVYTASFVTSTAPVTPPTPSGKWDISARPHTALLWPSPEAKILHMNKDFCNSILSHLSSMPALILKSGHLLAMSSS